MHHSRVLLAQVMRGIFQLRLPSIMASVVDDAENQ
jgi:hypothetical protein